MGSRASGNRLTCEPCRERKVKCNRVFPNCGRCSRLGYSCLYRDRVTQRDRQSAVITQLQQRLHEAEARIAVLSLKEPYQAGLDKHDSQTVSLMDAQADPALTSVESLESFLQFPQESVDGTTLDHADMQALHVESGLDMSWMGTVFNIDSLSASDPAPDAETSFEVCEVRQSHDDFVVMGNSADAIPRTNIAPGDLNELHQLFFDQFYPVMPIICKSRFAKELRESPDSLSVNSVSYAMALLATTIPGASAKHQKTCHDLAWHYVNLCEGGIGSDSLGSINTLQALLFLFRFETNTRSCLRSWLTLGRTTKLARMMRLDDIDRAGEPPVCDIAVPKVKLDAVQNLAEVEERRRCFWAVYIHEGLASVYSGIPTTLGDRELHVALPSPNKLDINFESVSMPMIVDVMSLSNPDLLSPFTGIILVISTLHSVLEHVSRARRCEYPQDSEGFWDRHYGLVKSLDRHETFLRPVMSGAALHSNALVFSQFLTFHAVRMRLYETAAQKSERQDMPVAVVDSHVNQRRTSALKVAAAIKSSWGRQRFACDSFLLNGAFVGWPIYMAIKTLSHETTSSSSSSSKTLTATLQLLRKSLDDVEGPNGTWHQLMRHITPPAYLM